MSEAAVRVKARSLSVGAAATVCAGINEPVTASSPSLASQGLAKPPSGRARLQPPRPAPIKIKVTRAPAGPNADRPMRVHTLYKEGLYGECRYKALPYGRRNALWTACGRNSELLGLPTRPP